MVTIASAPQSRAALARVREHAEHLLVDEFQDVNANFWAFLGSVSIVLLGFVLFFRH